MCRVPVGISIYRFPLGGTFVLIPTLTEGNVGIPVRKNTVCRSSYAVHHKYKKGEEMSGLPSEVTIRQKETIKYDPYNSHQLKQ